METTDTPVIDNAHVDLAVPTVERRERTLAKGAQPRKGDANAPLAVLNADAHPDDGAGGALSGTPGRRAPAPGGRRS